MFLESSRLAASFLLGSLTNGLFEFGVFIVSEVEDLSYDYGEVVATGNVDDPFVLEEQVLTW